MGARRRRNKEKGTPLSDVTQPNQFWCVDFKGEFKLGNGSYCYPLTVSDQASLYLLLCEALESTQEPPVMKAFRRLFSERGLPDAIRSDNGLPFASPKGLYNLSRLSVWWLRQSSTIYLLPCRGLYASLFQGPMLGDRRDANQHSADFPRAWWRGNVRPRTWFRIGHCAGRERWPASHCPARPYARWFQ